MANWSWRPRSRRRSSRCLPPPSTASSRPPGADLSPAASPRPAPATCSSSTSPCEWEDRRPGFVEIDLVAHGGESVHGEFVYTLGLVDVATGWFEASAVPTRSQRGVFAALQALRARLPFALLGIDSDNDNAFINDQLLRYCQAERLTFTRSREYRKNDQAHIEERNGAVIRRLIGYDRYEGEAATAAFNRLYEVQRQ